MSFAIIDKDEPRISFLVFLRFKRVHNGGCNGMGEGMRMKEIFSREFVSSV